jgi:hypothetical protein
MFCLKCGNQNIDGANFCRKCGTDLEALSPAPAKQDLISREFISRSLTRAQSNDPDELTAGGIANVIMGDGFFMVAVLLSAIHSSVSSPLWLFLLIPAFFFFGKGFADVLRARQIRRRMKESGLGEACETAELPPPQVSIIDTIGKQTSGELFPMSSVTEGTTRGPR